MASTLHTNRVSSVDILRGVVMIIMALDHVREFWSVTPFRPEDLTQTTPLLFFTRWITHLCAPVFALLSGVSIYFQLMKQPSKRAVTIFLLKRGVWLIVCELVLINFLMQHSFNLLILEVIWVLGWSMIIMAGLIWLPRWAVAVFAVVVIAGHDLLPFIQPVTLNNLPLAMLRNSPGVLAMPGFPVVVVAYTIFPWVGVVAAGFVMGRWFTLSPELERYTFLNTGLALLLIFLVLRFFNVYGDPSPWSVQPRGDLFTILSYINVSKYPPSFLFLCLMLGLAFMILWFINIFGKFIPNAVRVFGQVPFFFFILHIGIIVAGSVAWTYFSFGVPINLGFTPADQFPEGYTPSLIRTYMVWLIVIIVLYFPCKWFGAYKRRRGGWTSYW